MQILKQIEKLSDFLDEQNCEKACFADTGFLYALAYDDDRLHEMAIEVWELLEEHKITIYTNVIGRLEFVDLLFRKQVALGVIQLFYSLESSTSHRSLFNLLKSIRDTDTAERKQNRSFKVSESQLKKLRIELDQAAGSNSWKEFCRAYVGDKLANEWSMIEQDLGLSFIEVMEGGVSNHIRTPLLWKEMVQVMGEHGLRGPDAMIVNLFSKSEFPLLITGDGDMEAYFSESSIAIPNRAIFLLE